MHALLPKAPHCWAYFISFILVGTFFAMNSVIAILVSSLQFLDEEDDIQKLLASVKRIEEKLDRMKS